MTRLLLTLLIALSLGLLLNGCTFMGNAMKYGSAAPPEKLEEYITPALDKRLATCMRQRQVCEGMNRRQVMLTIGLPDSKATSNTIETWYYQPNASMYTGNVSFDGNEVISFTKLTGNNY